MARLNHDLNDEQPVCIGLTGGALTVHPATVEVSIQQHHRVHWFLSFEGKLDSIKFKTGNGPFRAPHNIPMSKAHVLSDIVDNQNYQDQHFKYTVTATPAGGTKTSIDPDVHVQPYPVTHPKRLMGTRVKSRASKRP